MGRRVREKTNRSRNANQFKWHVFCEGEKTEPNYLKSLNDFLKEKLNDSPINIIPHVVGKNAIEVVSDSVKFSKKSDSLIKVFAFFDKDDLTKKQFEEVIQKSINNNILPIWSNECFELWFILHLEYSSAEIPRKQYYAKLTKYLGKDYSKSDEDMFNVLFDKINKAYDNNKKLNDLHINTKSPYEQNPNTKVYEFFDEIDLIIKEQNQKSFWDLIKNI